MSSTHVQQSPLQPKTGNLLPGPREFNHEVEINGNEKWPSASYPHYLPTWSHEQKYPPLQPFEHRDPGLDADPKLFNLLSTHCTLEHLTPTIGTKVHGSLQIRGLSAAAKNDLALLVAQRKVVIFCNQDFADLPIPDALAWGSHFGRHHIHPTNGSPDKYPEIQIAHRGAGDSSFEGFFEGRTSSVAWHSDVTYEQQPPGTTIMYNLEIPESGGDTLFSDQAEAYRRLSPVFQQRLHGLQVVHSAVQQGEYNRKKGGILRREPIETVHPLVRTHPVTGEKALFVNKQFSRHIVGMKREESDMLLNFLYQHTLSGADFQLRLHWEPRMVVLWDNRSTAHSAIFDWASQERRHLARITPQAERPFETPFESVSH
ncbi:hypothetical protein N7537_011811 [Penicillium hordei]|uniref:TauD/TfdA-like domain-containing protein n=1 Tax=Penicillium hordei TaxID=40994 RepID=A0AAD6DMI2_9EURO|nr:uncharacterized protein N7537_011811 [Penicillium hordei]KAJ5589133.1 hypothetical protein N7537_011811 [Penicillium hordei]